MGIVLKSGDVTIKNNKTNKRITINSDNLFFEVVDVDNRNMGPEYTHVARYATSFDSGDDFELVVTVWEYPEGGYNNEEVELEVYTDGIEIEQNNLELGISLAQDDD